MGLRLASFVVWFAVAASAVFWGLRLLARPVAPPPHAQAAQGTRPAAGGDFTRLLGAAAPAPVAVAAAPVPAADNRFKLLGVVAPKGAGAGLALIAVDGKPARAYGLGATVEPPLVVLAVQHKGVSLGPREGPAQVRLDMPALPVAQRGQLAPATSGFPPPAALPGQVPVQPLPVVPPPTAVMPGSVPGGMPPQMPQPPAVSR